MRYWISPQTSPADGHPAHDSEQHDFLRLGDPHACNISLPSSPNAEAAIAACNLRLRLARLHVMQLPVQAVAAASQLIVVPRSTSNADDSSTTNLVGVVNRRPDDAPP